MSGIPPIRFISEKSKENEDDVTKANTVKITMDDDVTKLFKTFKSGGPEAVINLIRDHESIVEDRKLREKYGCSSALWNTKRQAVKKLDATTDADQITELEARIKEHKLICASTQQQAFDYFEKLLDPVNVQK